MKKRWTRTILIGIVAVLVIAAGAVAVFAQDGGSAATDDDQPAPLPYMHWRGHPGDLGYQQEDLAKALGITVEELEEAQREAKMMQIERAVEEGYVSAEQGNFMLAMLILNGAVDKHALLAAALDMDVEELEEAIEDGSLREALAEISPDDLQTGMEEAFDAALQQAVDDLLITEEQAELVREHLGAAFGYHHQQYGRPGWGGHGFGPRGYAPAPRQSSMMPYQGF